MRDDNKGPEGGRPDSVCNAVAKMWNAELRRKQHLSAEGQKAAALKARGKKLYRQQRDIRRRA